MNKTRTQRIAELNDLARTAMGVASRVIQTSGISALPGEVQSRIREKVEMFGTPTPKGDLRHMFTKDNDPHGERDFGTVYHEDLKVFWKIDYYDKAMEYGSEHPEDPAQTTRVLTIMLAEEY